MAKKKKQKQREEVDLGTPELRLKRFALAGNDRTPMAGSAIGVLLERGKITEEEYQAGLLYALARMRVFGVPFARANNLSDYANYHGLAIGSDDRDAENFKAYEDAVGVLRDCGGHGRAITDVESVVVFDAIPAWGLLSKQQDSVHREFFTRGIRALVKFYGL